MLLAVHLTRRDRDGWFSSSTTRVATTAYAITAKGLDIVDLDSGGGPLGVQQALERGQIDPRPTNGKGILVGIAPRNALSEYLARVARSEVTDVHGDNSVTCQSDPGAPAGAPDRPSFWAAQTSGRGANNLNWKARDGDWAIAVMNAGGSPRLSVGVSVAGKTQLLTWIGLGLLIIGLVAGGGRAALIVASTRQRRTRQ